MAIINSIIDISKNYSEGGGGGSDTSSINVGTINQNTGTMPTIRPDGTELKEGDWVAVDAGAIVPFNISYTKSGTQEVINVTNLGLRYYYNVLTTSWYQSAGSVVESNEVIVTNSVNETLDGTGTKQSNANQQVVTAIKNLQNNEVNGIDVSKSGNSYTFSIKHNNTTIDDATITIDSGIAEVATDDVVVDNPVTESISGTATKQNIVNSEVKTKINGLASEEMTLTNKTINAYNNNITHLKPQYCFDSNYYWRHVSLLDVNYYCFISDNGDKVYTQIITPSDNQVVGYTIRNENADYYLNRITDTIFYIDNFYPTNGVMLRGIRNGITTLYYRHECCDYVDSNNNSTNALTLPSSALSLEISYKTRNQCLNKINQVIENTIIDNINFYCWVSDDVINPEYVFTEKVNTGNAVAYTAQFVDNDISKDIISSAVINKEAAITIDEQDEHLILAIITEEGGTIAFKSFTRAENYDKKYVYKGEQKVINATKTLSLIKENSGGTSLVNVVDDTTYNGSVKIGNVNSNRVGAVYAISEGLSSTASGRVSHAENSSSASGDYSHSEGYVTSASGNYSHAEGTGSVASGQASHAGGNSSIASGNYSFTHGDNCEATATSSCAIGIYTHANAIASCAIGSNTTAIGVASSAQGQYTTANKKSQVVLGTYNKLDAAISTIHPSGDDSYGDYALIIGNGTSENNRQNALTVNWLGDLDMAGTIRMGAPLADGIRIEQEDYSGYSSLSNIVLEVLGPDFEDGNKAYSNVKFANPMLSAYGLPANLIGSLKVEGVCSAGGININARLTFYPVNEQSVYVNNIANGVIGRWTNITSGGGSSSGGDTLIETFAINEVFANSGSILSFTSAIGRDCKVTCTVNKNTNEGKLTASFYCNSSYAQSATGWKNFALIYTPNFMAKYVHTSTGDSTGKLESGRIMATMYTGGTYVNCALDARGYQNGYDQTTGAFRIYYTQEMLNCAGGVNLSIDIPIIKVS